MAPARRRRKKSARATAPARPRAKTGAPSVVARPEPPLARDGLEWLIERRRLKPHQVKAARHYRAAFRATDGVSLGSCLGALQRVDGSRRDLGLAVAVDLDAERRLRHLRLVVLGGQEDLLIVMDGVVGAGHVLLALAGGDENHARLMRLALGIALDLVSTHLTTVPESVAQKPTRRIASA